jgi:hypothetical protein
MLTRFEWDQKAAGNLRKDPAGFETALRVFADPFALTHQSSIAVRDGLRMRIPPAARVCPFVRCTEPAAWRAGGKGLNRLPLVGSRS